MISVTTNISVVAASLGGRFNTMTSQLKDKLTRRVADTLVESITNRIHEEGKKADDSPIGQYKNSYLKLRQKKGRTHSTDPKITFRFTDKMEKEFQVIATENGYGLGWIDAEGGSGLDEGKVTNFDKANYLEKKFGNVYSLTKSEKEKVKEITEDFIKKNLKT